MMMPLSQIPASAAATSYIILHTCSSLSYYVLCSISQHNLRFLTYFLEEKAYRTAGSFEKTHWGMEHWDCDLLCWVGFIRSFEGKGIFDRGPNRLVVVLGAATCSHFDLRESVAPASERASS